MEYVIAIATVERVITRAGLNYVVAWQSGQSAIVIGTCDTVRNDYNAVSHVRVVGTIIRQSTFGSAWHCNGHHLINAKRSCHCNSVIPSLTINFESERVIGAGQRTIWQVELISLATDKLKFRSLLAINDIFAAISCNLKTPAYIWSRTITIVKLCNSVEQTCLPWSIRHISRYSCYAIRLRLILIKNRLISHYMYPPIRKRWVIWSQPYE